MLSMVPLHCPRRRRDECNLLHAVSDSVVKGEARVLGKVANSIGREPKGLIESDG